MANEMHMELLRSISKGRAGCSLSLPPSLLAGKEPQWLEPGQAFWSMSRKPCLEESEVAGN